MGLLRDYFIKKYDSIICIYLLYIYYKSLLTNNKLIMQRWVNIVILELLPDFKINYIADYVKGVNKTP